MTDPNERIHDWQSRRIQSVTVWTYETEAEAYRVGKDGVTAIVPILKNGEYCELPYVQVWKGEKLYAEFGQHKCEGVYFDMDFANDH